MADHPKSLMEFICEAIDEALPKDAEVTGRDLYMRGWGRYEEHYFALQMQRRRREMEKALPLLARPETDFVNFEAE